MKYCLLKYNRDTDRVDVTPYAEDASAFEALRAETLKKLASEEVVLFLSDSEESLRKTHPRYFMSVSEMVDATLDAITKEMA